MKTKNRKKKPLDKTRKRDVITVDNILVPDDLQFTKSPYMYPKTSYFAETISTNPSYIRYINNAMTLLYAFNQNESCNNFVYAIQFEPDNPFSYWGAAYSIQMNVNHMIIPAEIMKFSIQCFQKALELLHKQECSPLITDLVLATRSRLFRPGTKPLDKVNTNPSFRDVERNMKTYSKKMKKLYKKYPLNNDICVLYAASIMMIDPWRWWPQGSIWQLPTTPLDMNNLKVKTSENVVKIFNTVLKRDPNHLGALHYTIHAIEESPYPALGLFAAKQLKYVNKELGHLLHMPSHIYSRTGDLKESIEANIVAIRSDERYKRRKEKILGKTLHTFYVREYMAHNIHFLVIDAERIGDFSLAKKYLDKLEKHVFLYIDGKTKKNMFLEHFLCVRAHVFLRFGKYKEIMSFGYPPKMYSQWLVEVLFCKMVSYIKSGLKEKADKHYPEFVKQVDLYKNQLPGESCRCGCQKRHGGISNPHLGMNKYEYNRQVARGRLKGLSHPEGSSINTNNRRIIAEIYIILVDGYLEWYYHSKTKALSFFEQAVKRYENLQYDEPAVYMNVVHSTYASALYQVGETEKAIYIAARGSIAYPGDVRLRYIQDLANNIHHPPGFYNVSKGVLNLDTIL